MPTHVALLRAVNVGGVKIAMADLRRVIAALGHSDVATYIQTGNVVFTSVRAGSRVPGASSAPAGLAAPADPAGLASEMETAIAAALGVRTPVIVVPRDELAGIVGGNPYAGEPNPRYVHGVFLPADPGEAAVAGVREAVARAAGNGSRDTAVLRGRTLYLHTPDGFGDSALARSLLLKRSSPVVAGTARNWATVTRLLALCAG